MLARMMFPATFSRGWPFFSYTPRRKKGSITSIMHMAAVLLPRGRRRRKNSGTPISAPAPKQISWRLVRLNMTFVFTRVRSLGTGTYAKNIKPPNNGCSWIFIPRIQNAFPSVFSSLTDTLVQDPGAYPAWFHAGGRAYPRTLRPPRRNLQTRLPAGLFPVPRPACRSRPAYSPFPAQSSHKPHIKCYRHCGSRLCKHAWSRLSDHRQAASLRAVRQSLRRKASRRHSKPRTICVHSWAGCGGASVPQRNWRLWAWLALLLKQKSPPRISIFAQPPLIRLNGCNRQSAPQYGKSACCWPISGVSGQFSER